MASSELGVGIFVYSLHDTPANAQYFNGKNPALISAAGALIKRMIHSPKKCRCCAAAFVLLLIVNSLFHCALSNVHG